MIIDTNRAHICCSSSLLLFLSCFCLVRLYIANNNLFAVMADWSNGICGCFGDCTTCLLSFICPCIQFGRNAEALGESCLLYALSQFVPLLNLYCRVTIRGKIREQKGIDGSCFNDLLCSWCCYECSLAQEGQELKGAGNQTMARE